MNDRRRRLTALARAVLTGTTLLGCGPHTVGQGARVGSDAVVERDAGSADASVTDAAVADAGAPDAGVVRIYCWLIADARCLEDGGAAPGVIDAC